MTLTLAESTTYALARRPLQGYSHGRVGSTTLGKNIETLRVAAGHVNAAAFARSIGITPATLNDWESGRYQNLRLDSLMRIARGIPCRFDALLAGVDDEYDKIVGSVSYSTVQKSTGVTKSTVPASAARTEGTHAPLVAASIDLRHLLTLSLAERVTAARALAMQLAILLRDSPEASSADTTQTKRPSGRRRVS